MSTVISRSELYDYAVADPRNPNRHLIVVNNNQQQQHAIVLAGSTLVEMELEVARNQAYCAATTDIIISVINIVIYVVAIGSWWPVFENKPVLISNFVVSPEYGKAIVIGIMLNALLSFIGILADFMLLTATSDESIEHERALARAHTWRYVNYFRFLSEYLTGHWISVLLRTCLILQVSDFIENLERHRRFRGRNF